LEFCASCTSRTIWASAVSVPIRVARTRSVPWVDGCADHGEPGDDTGRLSPVTTDSSTSLSLLDHAVGGILSRADQQQIPAATTR
jgi:hypothetical protein